MEDLKRMEARRLLGLSDVNLKEAAEWAKSQQNQQPIPFQETEPRLTGGAIPRQLPVTAKQMAARVEQAYQSGKTETVRAEMQRLMSETAKVFQNSPTRLIDQVTATTRGRRDNYGRPLINFLRIAIRWMEHLQNRGKLAESATIDPEDVAIMMTDLKLARAEHSYKDDNPLDVMGYMDCLDDIHQHMKELGFSEGVEHFRKMTADDLRKLRDNLLRQP